MQVFIQTVSLDPALEIQPLYVKEGWGQVNQVVKYDETDNTIKLFIAYVWDESAGEVNPLVEGPPSFPISVALMDVDDVQTFDPASNCTGIVKTRDNGYRVVMINQNRYEPTALDEQPTIGEAE